MSIVDEDFDDPRCVGCHNLRVQRDELRAELQQVRYWLEEEAKQAKARAALMAELSANVEALLMKAGGVN